MKILLAVDGSACSDAAVSAVAARPWPRGTEIKIISAFQMIFPMSPEAWAISAQYCEQLEQVGRDQAQAVVTKAAEKIKTAVDPSISVTTSVVTGSPQAAILEESEDWKADLIGVGSHGYSGWQRLLLGSVSLGVVSHAMCSVEVVRCNPAHDAGETLKAA
jgi:nucleotide-binding universal stress UspA family protein